MIIINYKTYKEASGENAVKLAKAMDEAATTSGVEMISCPQAVDLRDVVKNCQHNVWMQHIDKGTRGRETGWILPEIVKENGAVGTLLNHSEHKLSVGVLAETLNQCKEIGLKTLVFADSPEEVKIVAQLSPDYIGYEPPELIASPDTSVARSKPEVIEKVVKEISDIPVLVGAGVKDSKDVEVSLRLGAKGVVLASAVILAEDQKKVLEDLASGYKQ